MENAKRKAYDAAFKLKVIELADKEGNRAAARKFRIDESMVRRWKRQREELEQCKKSKKKEKLSYVIKTLKTLFVYRLSL